MFSSLWCKKEDKKNLINSSECDEVRQTLKQASLQKEFFEMTDKNNTKWKERTKLFEWISVSSPLRWDFFFADHKVSTLKMKMHQNWNLIFIFNFVPVVSATWKSHLCAAAAKRMNGQRVIRAAHTHTRTRKESQQWWLARQEFQPESASNNFRLLFFCYSLPVLCSCFVINFDTLLSSCSFLYIQTHTQFRWKKIQ